MTRPFHIAEEQWELMLANGRAVAADCNFEPSPVVTLCLPDGRPMFLLAELSPHNEDIAFGLVDLIFSKPMMRFVSLEEVSREPVGPSLRAKPYRTSLGLTEITGQCHEAGKIIDPPDGSASVMDQPH